MLQSRLLNLIYCHENLYRRDAESAEEKQLKLSVLSVSAVQNNLDLTIVLRFSRWVTYGKGIQ